MDKFDGVQRADIISVDYAAETLAQPRSLSGETKKTQVASLSTAIKPKNKHGLVWVRYAFCALILGVCLLGKFTSVDSLKTASGFIKDELSKDYVSELYDE